MSTLPKIYCFINGGAAWFLHVVAVAADDGTLVASHISSHEAWAQHDIGVTSEWKHDAYKARYPDGYEIEWVPRFLVGTHPGIAAAWEKVQAANHSMEKA